MSLILDALKRSERDRASHNAPSHGLFTGNDEPINSNQLRLLKQFYLPLILLVTLVLSGYLLLSFLNKSDAPDTTAEKYSISPPDSNNKQSIKPAGSENISTQSESVKYAAAKPPSKSPPLLAQLPRPLTPSQDSLAQALPTVKKSKTLQPARTDKTSNTPVSRTRVKSISKIESTNNAIQNLNEIEDSSVLSRLSTYEINTHIYSSKPERRFVLINMEKYREGQTISGSQFRIDEITAEGVVIDHGTGLVMLKAR